MGDGKRLYAKIWQHSCHITAGIAYALLEEFFDELIVLAYYKAFGIGAFLDDVEGEFARTDTCLLHNGCDCLWLQIYAYFTAFPNFCPFFCWRKKSWGEIEGEDDAGPGKGTQMPQMDTDISGSG